jgi:dihydroxyacetone kinase-like predicted kinase
MGISAMLAFDPDLEAEENAISMSKAASKVSTGQITFAARDSDFDGRRIKEGEILALENGRLAFVEQNVNKAILKLGKALCKKDSQFVTLIYGEDVSEADAVAAKAALESRLGLAEVTLINGGQPVYYYILSVE